jgi:hypothetical protein
VPFVVVPGQSYRGQASFNLKKAAPSLDQLNGNATLLGPVNYRASSDRFLSHSEPTIAMDPLDHDHLIAGSKMYENLNRYFFKIGTYESFDGGQTWTDQGMLPGYCTGPGECDPNDLEHYRVTSDVSISFDDEGNAYANVLDAPGGAEGPPGWNMQLHIKRPGQPWTGPITIHDNRVAPEAARLLLDDKNWLAVDNATTVDGHANRPRDGNIGTMYACWSLDGPRVIQQIVLMRSVDGGRTWGGIVPGDNVPYPLSQRSVISGIGCHVSIGPQGEVYATWYDNVLDALMQVKSTNRGATFTPARPIAQISGVNLPFEGQAFRNLSIPTTAVDRAGNVYVAVTSRDAEGSPVLEGVLRTPKEGLRPIDQEAGGDASGTGGDIVLFKSTDGGLTYSGPVRVNRDKGDADQFQPWIAVTDCGQVDVSYFDRRNDANNYFIQTWLSRSNDGGRTFTDVPVGHRFWDPSVNPPVSPSGQFIGDYQGLVADDRVAIPFWNDTQGDTLPAGDAGHSPYQEVWAARIPNTPEAGGPAPGAACPAAAGPAGGSSPLPVPAPVPLPALPPPVAETSLVTKLSSCTPCPLTWVNLRTKPRS